MMRRKRRTPREYIIAGCLGLLLVFLLLQFWGILRKEELARHAAEDAKQELAALGSREDTLKKNIADLNTERGQEASLRETYGVAKPGEEVIIVVPAEEGQAVPTESWWQKFLGWLGFG